MSAQLLPTTAVVLDREGRGESWLRLALFAREHGVLHAQQRRSRRAAATTVALDLFDEVRTTLESRNQGQTWFVREAEPLRRRPRLGASYSALQAACRFARVLLLNPLHEDGREAAYALLQRALDAWETGVRPDAIYGKSLFLFARDEGYPVREEWLAQLDRDDRATMNRILREAAADQTTPVREVDRLTAALEEYLRQNAAMRFGE
jgi:recombinational DNA repair protein (RecF pathway)